MDEHLATPIGNNQQTTPHDALLLLLGARTACSPQWSLETALPERYRTLVEPAKMANLVPINRPNASWNSTTSKQTLARSSMSLSSIRKLLKAKSLGQRIRGQLGDALNKQEGTEIRPAGSFK